MELVGLSKFFGGVAAIKDFSIAVAADEYVTLLGPSGSGKSTLLRLMAGLECPDAGNVMLDGQDITALPAHRRGVGFVQQKFGLFPHMSVFDNVAFGLRNREERPVKSEQVVREKVSQMLDIVGLVDFGHRKVGALSGGQRQRVSLARTLVCEPKICLLDEPLGALDANLRERMTVELRRIRTTLGLSFVHVTGNENEALAMGDRMVVMDHGEAVQISTPDVIYHAPGTVRIAKLLSRYNIFKGHQEGNLFRTGNNTLAVPGGVEQADYTAIRFDSIVIDKQDNAGGVGNNGMWATYMASEFLGAHAIYFFKTTEGVIVEVERHLSDVTPGAFSEGDHCFLRWKPKDSLFFDHHGALVPAGNMYGRAAS